jgi:quinolinate synthase
MLWQPALDERYIKATDDELAAAITARRQELGSKLVILGHHYQTDRVIRHADFTGDSLKLAQTAASHIAKARSKFVMFCGVHFMAETADMLTPDDVAVILPDLSAGCSMADMAGYEEAVSAWDALTAALKKARQKVRIVPVTYINSSAAIKAFVGQRGGAVCTSSNAVAILKWALAGGDQSAAAGEHIKVLFLPDQHLGRNSAAAMGIDTVTGTALYDPRRANKGEPLGGMSPEQLKAASVLLWAGHCSVHKLFRAEHVHMLRAGERDLPPHERTTVLVHPECSKEVVDLADLSGSTEYIISTNRKAPAGAKFAVGTETNLVQRCATEARARGVSVRILSDCQCLCTTMYRIDQAHMLWVLDQLAVGKVVNRITVHPEARTQSLLALERMLKLSGTTPAAIKAGAAGATVPD